MPSGWPGRAPTSSRVDVCEPTPGVPYAGATRADLDETVRLVEEQDRRIVARQVYVRDLAGLQAAVDEGVGKLGSLDIAVANAGVMGGWDRGGSSARRTGRPPSGST